MAETEIRDLRAQAYLDRKEIKKWTRTATTIFTSPVLIAARYVLLSVLYYTK